MATVSEFAAIEPALSAMLGPCVLLEPLPGGTGGTSFLIEAGGLRCVAKRFAAGVPVLLGPEWQFDLLRALAAAGVAPEPLGVDGEARLLVTRFVADAASLASAELREPRTVVRLTELLGRLHAVEFELPPFDPVAYAQSYVAAIGGADLLETADQLRFEELLEIAEAPLPGSPGICHNDLTADNILFGSSSRLIDFDYAVSAPPILDLASAAVMNGFTGGDASQLLQRYFGGHPPFVWEEFARVQRLVRLLAHFWAQASAVVQAVSMTQYRIDDD